MPVTLHTQSPGRRTNWQSQALILTLESWSWSWQLLAVRFRARTPWVPAPFLLRDLHHSPYRITLEESESMSKGSKSVLYYLTVTPLQSNTEKSKDCSLLTPETPASFLTLDFTPSAQTHRGKQCERDISPHALKTAIWSEHVSVLHGPTAHQVLSSIPRRKHNTMKNT